MGRRKGKKSSTRDKIPLEDATDTLDEGLGKKDSFYDDLDEFEDNEDRELIQKISRSRGGRNRDRLEGGEEVFGILDSDDSDAEYVKPKKRKNLDNEDEFLDDIEDETEQRYEDEQVGTEGWGKKKKYFYGGNPNDKMQKKDDKDEELLDGMDEAEYEEQESKKMQMKQLQMMDEEDFLGTFTASEKKEVNKKKGKKDGSKSVSEKISLDVSKMSRKEQLKLFAQESPEFQGIVDEFEEKMKFVQEKLNPIVQLVDQGKLPKGKISDYIKAKQQLCLNYCTNILCYLMFKAKRTSLKCHPLTSRLVQYKQLLDQSSEQDQHIMGQVEDILDKINEGQDISKLVKRERKRKMGGGKKKSSKRLRILEPNQNQDFDDIADSMNQTDLTADELKALELYRSIQKKKNADESESDEDETEIPENKDENEGNAEVTAEERRSITYQMEKNKGLAPKRNKLQRNPRVKHRHKYQKAKVRRKGQVREVRTEVKKYGGEYSGINARVKKGIKLS